jgi:hypothetical protein
VRKKVTGSADKADDDDGFAALAQLELPRKRRRLTKMIVHLVDGTYELFRHFYRVKGFASRGLVGLS